MSSRSKLGIRSLRRLGKSPSGESSSVKSKDGVGVGVKQKGNSKTADALSGLLTTLTIVNESLDGVPAPGLKAAIGGILEITRAIRVGLSVQDGASDTYQVLTPLISPR